MEKNIKKSVVICITEPLCGTAEINTTQLTSTVFQLKEKYRWLFDLEEWMFGNVVDAGPWNGVAWVNHSITIKPVLTPRWEVLL